MQLEFRGLYQSRYLEFLFELGGTKQIPSSDRFGLPLQFDLEPFMNQAASKFIYVAGDEWMAVLEPEDHVIITSSLRIPRSRIHFFGQLDVINQIVSQFRLKAFRGGG